MGWGGVEGGQWDVGEIVYVWKKPKTFCKAGAFGRLRWNQDNYDTQGVKKRAVLIGRLRVSRFGLAVRR